MEEESGELCSGHRVTVSSRDDHAQSQWPLQKDSAVQDRHSLQDEAAKLDPKKHRCLSTEQPLLGPRPGDILGCH